MTFWNNFLIFPRKQDLTFHANCLQIACNIKSCFLGKISSIWSSAEFAQTVVNVDKKKHSEEPLFSRALLPALALSELIQQKINWHFSYFSSFHAIYLHRKNSGIIKKKKKKKKKNSLFVCVEVLRPSQPNGVMSSAVSLPNHTFTGQA